MRITDKINFRQPKYMLPAIVYIPLIATGYFVFDMFNTEVAETQDKNLQTTEFLNPNLPLSVTTKKRKKRMNPSTQKKTLRNSSVRQKRRTMQPKWPMPRREKRKHSKHSTRHSPKRG